MGKGHFNKSATNTISVKARIKHSHSVFHHHKTLRGLYKRGVDIYGVSCDFKYTIKNSHCE